MTANLIAEYPQSGAMVLIQKQVLASAVASVNFSVPPSYTNLRLVINCASSGGTAEAVNMQFNGDTAAHYNAQLFLATGSGTSPFGESGETSIFLGNTPVTAANGGSIVVDIPNYSGTVFDKTTNANWTCTTTSTGMQSGISGGIWLSAAAITAISLALGTADNFIIGSTFSLYGLS